MLASGEIDNETEKKHHRSNESNDKVRRTMQIEFPFKNT